MELPGSLFGSLKPPVSGASGGLIRAIFQNLRRSWYVDVEGFDTSLSADEIKEALMNHFKSCGAIARVFLNTNPETNVVDSHASIAIMGDDVDEKVKELDRSELGGRKLIVKPAQLAPKVIIRDVPFA
ncbi:PREDICTED: nucleolin 1-like isoform X3 [Camelina sativa]|uniref:Nucleolin 1-like isoform X3 n=1 Tax=Camelina sativa TaxID=90675 RepID=A0ABM0TVX3_CAMSA|nr:PREDICTED: nucleolin 1-like isoform X3 [Camelina sativa]